MIAAQDLSGKVLVSAADGKVLGTIRECVCLLSTGEVLGLIVDASARLLGEKAIAGEDISVIGSDAVLVEDENRLVEPSDVPRLEDYLRPAEAEPLAVFTTSGKRLGAVGRIMIDEKQKRVVSYEVVSGPLRGLAEGARFMPILPGVVHGEDSVLVPPEAADKLQPPAVGLSTVWERVSEGVAKLKSRLEEEREPAEAARPEPSAPKKKPAKKTPAKKKVGRKPAKKKPKKVAKKSAKKPSQGGG